MTQVDSMVYLKRKANWSIHYTKKIILEANHVRVLGPHREICHFYKCTMSQPLGLPSFFLYLAVYICLLEMGGVMCHTHHASLSEVPRCHDPGSRRHVPIQAQTQIHLINFINWRVNVQNLNLNLGIMTGTAKNNVIWLFLNCTYFVRKYSLCGGKSADIFVCDDRWSKLGICAYIFVCG